MRVNFYNVVSELNEVADMYAAGEIDKAEAMVRQCDILKKHGFDRAAKDFRIAVIVEYVYDNGDEWVMSIGKGNKGMRCEDIKKFRWKVVE